MWRVTRSLLLLLVGVALSLGVSITPIVRQGSTDINISPFVQLGDGLYYFERSTTVNWYQAFEGCRRLNATLISFETMKEWNDVNGYLEQSNDQTYYWTSGTDHGQQSRHVWFGTGQKVDINIWGPGQPDNNNNEHCDQMNYKKKNTNHKLGLNDAQCSAKMRYICEVPRPYTASFVIWK